jgi:hypothetical protein
MHVVRKSLLASGAVVAAVALAVAAINVSSPGGGVSSAPGADQVAAQSPADLSSVFVPVSAYPEGTTLEQFPIQEALESGMLQPPADITIKPEACTDLLAAAVGDLNKVSGWVQRGQRPDLRVVDALVATVPGGADLGKLRQHIQGCGTGTITVESAKLTGEITLKEFPVSAPSGVEAIGIQQTVTFEDDSEFAQTMELVGSSAQAYLTSGDQLVAACEWEVAQAIENALEMLQNLGELSS